MARDGGPAFPRSRETWPDPGNPALSDTSEAQEGMSLRDWFAGQAMMVSMEQCRRDGIIENASNVAMGAYAIADAMLEERERRTDGD